MANTYTNTNTNMTTSSGLTPGMQTYYNRELLRTFEPNLVHLQFGDEYRMPANSGVVMNMRKLIPIDAKTVIYANGKTARATLTPTDKLTSKEIRKAVKTLKKNHAQTFNGYYIAIVGPDTTYDLQEDDAWVKVSQYQDKENIYTGEVGRLFGVRFVESTEAKIFEDAGESSADVASVIVLGQYAYGITSLKGANPRIIAKNPGSAGASDPLDQISSVGWKLDGFAAKLLQPEFAVRIECGFTA